jgi:hypothetical protein
MTDVKIIFPSIIEPDLNILFELISNSPAIPDDHGDEVTLKIICASLLSPLEHVSIPLPSPLICGVWR